MSTYGYGPVKIGAEWHVTYRFGWKTIDRVAFRSKAACERRGIADYHKDKDYIRSKRTTGQSPYHADMMRWTADLTAISTE